MNQEFLINRNGEVIGNCLITPEESVMIGLWEGKNIDPHYRGIFREEAPVSKLAAILRVVAIGLSVGLSISSIGHMIADLDTKALRGIAQRRFGVDSALELSGEQLSELIEYAINLGELECRDPRKYSKYSRLLIGAYIPAPSIIARSENIIRTLQEYLWSEISKGRSFQQVGDALQQLETGRVKATLGVQSIFEIRDPAKIEPELASFQGSRYLSYLKRYLEFVKDTLTKSGNATTETP